MSLTKATYSMIEGAPINIADFGAVGDNVADDTAAIQAAFTAVDNRGCIVFPPSKTFKTTSAIVMPPSTFGVVIQGNGSTIRAAHNGNGLDLTSTNENFSRFAVYNLTIQGPNVSFPNNPTELAGTSTGAGLKMGYNDTSNTPAGYLSTFVNCTFTNFYQGVYLQSVLLCNFIGGSAFFNQYGMFIDGGQTNANNFRSFSLRQNRIAGLYSSGRTGGSLSNATANTFEGCIFETNIPYDLSTGGYPSTFDATKGYGVHLLNSYGFVFNACYFENQNYNVVLDGSADGNTVNDTYFTSGGGGVRPGAVLITGSTCANNVLNNCFMFSGTVVNYINDNPSSNTYNQVLDCSGVNFDPAGLGTSTYIRNSRKSQGAGLGDFVGLIQMPSQGYVDNVGEGTASGTITGIGTATATLNTFGFGEFQFGNQITGATTITTISGQRPAQFLVLRNYQNTHAVTLKAAADGTGDIVLTGNVDVVFNTFGQQIVLYVASGLGGTRCYEVGRNF
jgi:hypothetical protein